MRKYVEMIIPVSLVEISVYQKSIAGEPNKKIEVFHMKQTDIVKKTLIVNSLSRKETKKNKKIANTKVRHAVKKNIKKNIS